MAFDFRYEMQRIRRKDTWPLICIVVLNALLWIAMQIAPQPMQECLGLPKDPALWLVRPWTLVTYMFVQYGFWHLLGNMLVLWWFGYVLLISARRGYIWCLYLAGGLAGGAVYLLAGLLGVYETGVCLIGSSAAMLAVVCATAMRSPDYALRLLLIGDIRIKWIALVVVLLSLASFVNGSIGSGLAHLGGVAAGLAWGAAIRRGRDLFGFIMRPKGRREPRRSSRRFKKKMQRVRSNTDELDALLDKVRVSGYESLTGAERERLRILSQNIKN